MIHARYIVSSSGLEAMVGHILKLFSIVLQLILRPIYYNSYFKPRHFHSDGSICRKISVNASDGTALVRQLCQYVALSD